MAAIRRAIVGSSGVITYEANNTGAIAGYTFLTERMYRKHWEVKKKKAVNVSE